MERELQNIQPGMPVYSSDNENVGEVEEVGFNYLRTRKGWFFVKERFIPFDAVSRIDVDGLYLTVAKAQLDAMDWDHVPDIGAGTVDADATGSTAQQGAAVVELDQDGVAEIPIATEESNDGTRNIETTVASVYPQADDTASEQAGLRDETVRSGQPSAADVVQRSELAAFQDGTIEVRATHEEITVTKQARVVEEVVLKKSVTERTESVHDTVRRTRVDIDDLPGRITRADATTSVATTSTSADASVVTPAKSSTTADASVVTPGKSKGKKRGGRGRRRLP